MNIFYVPLCLWDQGCSSDTFSFQFLTGCPVHLDIPIFTERFVEPEYQVPVLQVPGTAALALVAESITDGKTATYRYLVDLLCCASATSCNHFTHMISKQTHKKSRTKQRRIKNMKIELSVHAFNLKNPTSCGTSDPYAVVTRDVSTTQAGTKPDVIGTTET